jgi:hypothetical protein
MDSFKVNRFDDFAKRTRSRRANLVTRGLLAVRRSGSEMERNAENVLFGKSSLLTFAAMRENIKCHSEGQASERENQ